MTSKIKSSILNNLRKLDMWGDIRKATLKAGLNRVCVGNFKNGKPKYLNMYECVHCRGSFVAKDIDVDHIFPNISMKGLVDLDWTTYIDNLICTPVEGRQLLCKPCHVNKTNAERAKK
jgi:hypothetical protein